MLKKIQLVVSWILMYLIYTKAHNLIASAPQMLGFQVCAMPSLVIIFFLSLCLFIYFSFYSR